MRKPRKTIPKRIKPAVDVKKPFWMRKRKRRPPELRHHCLAILLAIKGRISSRVLYENSLAHRKRDIHSAGARLGIFSASGRNNDKLAALRLVRRRSRIRREWQRCFPK